MLKNMLILFVKCDNLNQIEHNKNSLMHPRFAPSNIVSGQWRRIRHYM